MRPMGYHCQFWCVFSSGSSIVSADVTLGLWFHPLANVLAIYTPAIYNNWLIPLKHLGTIVNGQQIFHNPVIISNAGTPINCRLSGPSSEMFFLSQICLQIYTCLHLLPLTTDSLFWQLKKLMPRTPIGFCPFPAVWLPQSMIIRIGPNPFLE